MQFLKRTILSLKQYPESILMLLISLFVIYPSLYNGWVMWDDPTYVLENKFLDVKSFIDVVDMFCFQFVQGNYHPLTILSLSIDYAIDGINPFVFHTTNLLFHLLNSMLVYVLIFKLFKNRYVAFFVSLLFAIHPMHVESFAWVSERKDVLYVFFFLIGLLHYLTYQKTEKTSSYLWCLLFFILSLFSKGMAVVFPIVLLLLDYLNKRKFVLKVILEKIPFFALSLVFGIIVIWAQNDSNAISNAESHPFSQAILIPIHGLLLYFVKAIIPFNLSAMHPYPMMVDGKVPLEILYSFIPLSIIGLVLVKMYWKNRKILFGLAFFIVVIFPVLQFVSVGSAMISERYTYLSYIGLFIVIGLILDKAYTESNGLKKNLIVSLSILYLIFLGFQTHQRIFVWQNDETLWSDVIESYPGDYFGYFKRGSFRAKNGKSDAALVDLNTSIAIFQNDYYSFNNRGMIYLSKRNYELAEKDFSKAIQIDSTLYEAHLNRGLIYLNTKKYQLAEFDFKNSASLAPNNALCFLNQALLYERMDSFHLAQENYIRALELSPKNAEGYKYRGLFYLKIAKYENALSDFNQFLQWSNQHPEGFYLKAKALLFLKRKKEARAFAQKANSMGYSLSQKELGIFYD